MCRSELELSNLNTYCPGSRRVSRTCIGWSIVRTVFLYHWSACALIAAKPIARAMPLIATKAARGLRMICDCGFIIEISFQKHVSVLFGLNRTFFAVGQI